MSIRILQEEIRRRKTPLAPIIGPAPDRIVPMIPSLSPAPCGGDAAARTETLYAHGVRVLDAAASRAAAAVLKADAYLRYGAAGFDVLARLVGAAKARGLYTVADCRAAAAAPWLEALPQADAVTVLPYLGGDACAAPDGKAVFAAVVTANPSAGDLQELRAGDRKLAAAAAEQAARHGAGLLLESDYALDIRDMRRRAEQAFFLLTDAAPADAVYAFDDYGRGALCADGQIQYAEDPAAALEQAAAEWRKWVTVV